MSTFAAVKILGHISSDQFIACESYSYGDVSPTTIAKFIYEPQELGNLVRTIPCAQLAHSFYTGLLHRPHRGSGDNEILPIGAVLQVS